MYKKTKQIPMKVDEVAQAEFIEQFEQLQAEKEAAEVHYFIDAAHPTLNRETSYGWIEKGAEHQVLSNSGRTRMNLLGALNPNEVTDIITKEYKTIDSEAAQDFLEELGRRNPEPKKIRIFIDKAKYFKKLEKDELIADQRIAHSLVAKLRSKFELNREIMAIDEEKSVEKQVLWNGKRISRES